MAFSIDSEQYYSMKEVARLLNVSLELVRKYRRDGRMRSCRVGLAVYIKGEAVLSFLEREADAWQEGRLLERRGRPKKPRFAMGEGYQSPDGDEDD